MLHTPIYRGSKSDFCGPTAMAAVTGASLHEVREAIYQARGHHFIKSDGSRMPIMGMTNNDLLGAMAELGWHVVEQMFNLSAARLYPTLAQFSENFGHRGPFIVEVTGHYVAISHGEFCDTRSKLPVDLGHAMTWRRMPGRWVRNFWRFEQQAA